MDFSTYTSHQKLLLLLLLCGPNIWPCFLGSAGVVTHLPGFAGTLPFYMETGYVIVDDLSGAQLFYYFIESEKNPKVDPLLLWLSGGPGCSSFVGLATEIGPVLFKIVPYNESEKTLPSFVSNPYSWTNLSSIIFLDWRVGSGFSWSPSSQDYNSDDLLSSDKIYIFLLKWFMEHPHFMLNPLYIAGDSYGGKVVPIVAQKLAGANDVGQQKRVNFKGYIVGNPVTNEEDEYASSVTYALGVGIIPSELFLAIRTSCVGESYLHRTKPECAANLDIFDGFTKEISAANILDPSCPLDYDPWGRKLSKPFIRWPRIPHEEYDELCSPPPALDINCPNYAYYLAYYWANSHETREALHIKEGTVQEWVRCNIDLNYTRNIESSAQYHLNVTRSGFRALVYSGDHDMLVPFFSTIEWIRSLNISIRDEWRSWHVDGQVAGYTELYSGNLTFATVKGAGHTAPSYRPKQCFTMFERWISGEPL